MPFAKNLRCPICNKEYGMHDWRQDTCGFRLRIQYNMEERANTANKSEIKGKPLSHWKYWQFFPLNNQDNQVSIGEGGTNLVKSKRLGEKWGLKNLYFKLELSNPSGSFKDRPISIGVSMAKENGASTVSAASSGNAAASLSSLGAKAGMDVVVFVPERASAAKVAQLVTLGAKVIRVSGGEDSEGDPSVKLFKAAVDKWGWVPSPSFGPFNPHQFEGTKSLAYETVEQLDWQAPDWVIANTGSGGLLSGTAQGFKDWYDLDWIDKIPKMVVVQPDACKPIVTAFNNKVKPFEFADQPGFPDTVAGGLADPHPWDGDAALEMLYLTKGYGVGVSDPKIMEGQRLLASHEGIFGSPSGVAAIAGLEAMVNNGIIDPADVVVVPITGHGLKDPAVLQDQFEKAIVCPADVEQLAKKMQL
ncbi:MAG: threonine synthase [Candidatus Heimdallarchaeota archaeon]|nr:threonine synthase [Candidatus Heimdallarchaeota archaeon]